jgi:hypothetical protein
MMQGVRVPSCPVNSLRCSSCLRHSYGSSGSSASSSERGAQCECPLHSTALLHKLPLPRGASPTRGMPQRASAESHTRNRRPQKSSRNSHSACACESIGALERCERRCMSGAWAGAGTGRKGCGRARAGPSVLDAVDPSIRDLVTRPPTEDNLNRITWTTRLCGTCGALASRDGVLANLRKLDLMDNSIPSSDPSLSALHSARPHVNEDVGLGGVAEQQALQADDPCHCSPSRCEAGDRRASSQKEVDEVWGRSPPCMERHASMREGG